MFYMVKEMRSEQTAQITRDLDRDYEAVLDFVHEVQEASGNIDEFEISTMQMMIGKLQTQESVI